MPSPDLGPPGPLPPLPPPVGTDGPPPTPVSPRRTAGYPDILSNAGPKAPAADPGVQPASTTTGSDGPAPLPPLP